MNDALPSLEQARTVSIVTVDPDEKDKSAQGIRDHLVRHGVEAEVRWIVGKGMSPGDTLASATIDLGADLVIMSACSRSGVRGMLTGSTTNKLLQIMTTPVTMSR